MRRTLSGRILAITTGIAVSVAMLGAGAPPASATNCTTIAVTSTSFQITPLVDPGTTYCLDLSSMTDAANITAAKDWGWSDNASNGIVDITSNYDAGTQVLTWTPLGRPNRWTSYLTLDSPTATYRIDYSWAGPTLNGQPATEVFREDGNSSYPNSRPSQDGGWGNDAIITFGTYPTTQHPGDTVTEPLQVVCSNPNYDPATGTSTFVVKLWDTSNGNYIWPDLVPTGSVAWMWGTLNDSQTTTTNGSWTQTGAHWTWNGTMTFSGLDIGYHSMVVWSYGSGCNGGGIYTYVPGIDVVDPHGVSDSMTVNAGATTALDVLANDPTGSQIDAITTSPSHGTAQIVNGQISYTPDQGFSGTDTLQYSVVGVTGNVDVSINVVMPAPDDPQNLAAGTVTSHSVQLSWDPPSQVGAGVDSYLIYETTADANNLQLVGSTTQTSYTADGLDPYTEYNFMVQTQATDQQTSPGSLFSQRTDPGQIAPNSDPETTQSGGAVDVPVNNVTPNAVITLGALAHGVRTATVNGQSVHIVAATGFSGLISQPVTVQDQGATVTVHLTMVVNPAAPRGAHFTTARHARTLVTWSSASGATGYTVTVGGKTICHTTSTHRSCLIPSLAGPKSTVKVMSNGGDATTSALVAATYVAPAKAVVIGSVGFGTRDIDLTKVTRPQVDAFARQIARQGFNRIVIRGYAASVATDKASVARQWRDSRLRAFAVANELKTQLHAAGSHASVTVTWFGATNPIANNLSFFGRIQNRRADIVVA